MQPVDSVTMEAWWKINVGYVTEDDIRVSGVWFSN